MSDQHPPLEASVTIQRKSLKDNKLRQIIVKLDDKPFATLFYDKQATRTVAPGMHKLRVDNTFIWKNLEFEVEPGGHVTFQVINRNGRFTWPMVAILGAGPMYLTVERQA